MAGSCFGASEHGLLGWRPAPGPRRAVGTAKGWSTWAAAYIDPSVPFVDTDMPATETIVAGLRRLDRVAVLREAADLVYAMADTECTCGGCDSGAARGCAERLLNRADAVEGETGMAIQRMDNVGIVVEDMDAAIAFFVELGMELEGRAEVEGLFADQCTGLDGVRCDIAMVRTPDGHSRLELAKYRSPAVISAGPRNRPHNILGTHRVMFAVDDIEDTVARLRPHGAELVGEIARFEDSYLLCYLRGPEGIIVGLAEQLR
ncbi:hypothetical protein GCM10010121_073700 [Streptomyces brasiliensis]|uniref:VOC domain-containing protein n=5 Tax=Actinomycetes TaxID=1760 RepID=A0A917L8A5_9ACTN|nr:hypothetical protein GCM10010121_073700 [Streptomyces brasiliensis]